MLASFDTFQAPFAFTCLIYAGMPVKQNINSADYIVGA